jgi:hypothetical protein
VQNLTRSISFLSIFHAVAIRNKSCPPHRRRLTMLALVVLSSCGEGVPWPLLGACGGEGAGAPDQFEGAWHGLAQLGGKSQLAPVVRVELTISKTPTGDEAIGLRAADGTACGVVSVTPRAGEPTVADVHGGAPCDVSGQLTAAGDHLLATLDVDLPGVASTRILASLTRE